MNSQEWNEWAQKIFGLLDFFSTVVVDSEFHSMYLNFNIDIMPLLHHACCAQCKCCYLRIRLVVDVSKLLFTDVADVGVGFLSNTPPSAMPTTAAAVNDTHATTIAVIWPTLNFFLASGEVGVFDSWGPYLVITCCCNMLLLFLINLEYFFLKTIIMWIRPIKDNFLGKLTHSFRLSLLFFSNILSHPVLSLFCLLCRVLCKHVSKI